MGSARARGVSLGRPWTLLVAEAGCCLVSRRRPVLAGGKTNPETSEVELIGLRVRRLPGTLRSLPLLPVRAGGVPRICLPATPGSALCRRSLIVTNDFPPRPGGIQSFVHALAVRLPAGSVDRVRARLGGRGRSFDAGLPFPVDAASHLADAPGALGGPPGEPDPRGRRLRHGAVRRGGAARAARAGPAPGRGPAPDRDHPRPRGRLGGAARRPAPAAADRGFRGHGHLPGRVHAGAARAGAVPGRPRPA